MELNKEQRLLQSILTRAWEDEAFKQELIAYPIRALERLTGEKINLPKDRSIVVQDQTDTSTIYINIPAKPNLEDMELSETQLEVIAGGGVLDPVIADSAASLSPLC